MRQIISELFLELHARFVIGIGRAEREQNGQNAQQFYDSSRIESKRNQCQSRSGQEATDHLAGDAEAERGEQQHAE
jgi:hypothetical protein